MTENPTGRGGGYLPGGIGWYHKTFTVNEERCQQLAFIEFDGVMANSDVWINGLSFGRTAERLQVSCSLRSLAI